MWKEYVRKTMAFILALYVLINPERNVYASEFDVEMIDTELSVEENEAELTSQSKILKEKTDGIKVSTGIETKLTDNSLKQNYETRDDTVSSYLVNELGGYLRVEHIEGKVLIEHYNEAFMLQSRQEINDELPRFGGFYAGNDAYYIVFGQLNNEEDSVKEVIRIVKFSKNWERIGAASLKGGTGTSSVSVNGITDLAVNGITEPFTHGSLRMEEVGQYLYIRTCRTMYTTIDGYTHQSNLTLMINTVDMSITSSHSFSSGYVSHSFNQFIKKDKDDNLIVLDHGDAYPRSAVLARGLIENYGSVYNSFTNYSEVDILAFPGETGNNYTGASLGGLECSNTSYLVAGNSVEQNDNFYHNQTRNIFVGIVSQNNFNAGAELAWITNYANDGLYSSTTPHLVKLNDNKFLLLWDELKKDKYGAYREYDKIRYVFLDGEGKLVSPIFSADGMLSDCHPIVSNNKVIWYTTKNEKSMSFYCVDDNGNFERICCHKYYEPNFDWSSNYSSCNAIFNCITCGKSEEVKCSVTSNVKKPSCTAKGKTVYKATVSFMNKTYVDKNTVTSPKLGHKYKKICKNGMKIKVCSRCYSISKESEKPKNTEIIQLNAKKKGFIMKWKKCSKATGYEIQYSISPKFKKNDTKKEEISKIKTTSKRFEKLKRRKNYYVRIRTYQAVKVNGKSIKVTSSWSKVKKVKTK